MSVRVEIGAGARAHDGFVAFDVNPRNADVVGDALHLPFRTASVEALRAVDVLEHLHFRDTDRALREWARVCAPGAPFYVQVPAADVIMRWFTADDPRLGSWVSDGRRHRCTSIHGAQWRLLGGGIDGVFCHEGDDFRWNSHYAMFSESSLTESLRSAGFSVNRLQLNEHPNYLVDAIRA